MAEETSFIWQDTGYLYKNNKLPGKACLATLTEDEIIISKGTLASTTSTAFGLIGSLVRTVREAKVKEAYLANNNILLRLKLSDIKELQASKKVGTGRTILLVYNDGSVNAITFNAAMFKKSYIEVFGKFEAAIKAKNPQVKVDPIN